MLRILRTLLLTVISLQLSFAQSLGPLTSQVRKDSKTIQHLTQVRRLSADTAFHKSVLPTAPVEGVNDGELHFPYPTIFVHGLSSSADAWADFYAAVTEGGWSYGGQLRYHLNADLDNGYSNIYDSEYAEIVPFDNLPGAADFYLVNFNVSTYGKPLGEQSNPYLSNQSAIVKQGVAVADAVRAVLEACGVDRVILFGHSMGGLAIREYLQNPDLWAYRDHHGVAKFISSGTPHGGSNASGGALVDLFYEKIDEQSDAVRDLRESYSTGKNGVYLFGGVETSVDIDNSIFNDYYDVDVNCNGQIGDRIEGLNQKTLPGDLDYAVIYGTAENDVIGRPGDGIVNHHSSQIKNFYPGMISETFHYHTENEDDWEVHTDLPKQVVHNFYALDEADEPYNAYTIDTDRNYYGHITEQAEDAECTEDYDAYYFELAEARSVEITINGVSGLRPQYIVIDMINEKVVEEGPLTEQFLSSMEVYEAGQYVLGISSVPTKNSWKYGYAFRVQTTEPDVTSVPQVQHTAISVSPNPATHTVTISGLEDGEAKKVKLYDMTGRRIFAAPAQNNTIDVSKLKGGLYQVIIDDRVAARFIKQ